MDSAVASADDLVEIRTVADTTIELQGYELAVTHDPSRLALASIEVGAAVQSAELQLAQPIASGWSVSVVYDLSPPFDGVVHGL